MLNINNFWPILEHDILGIPDTGIAKQFGISDTMIGSPSYTPPLH